MNPLARIGQAIGSVPALLEWVGEAAARASIANASPTLVRARTTPPDFGAAAIKAAQRELGKGEAGFNNGGADVVRYRRGVDDRQPWCAAFVSYCLEEGCAALGLPCPVKRSHSAKRLVQNVLEAGGRRVDLPEPGCLALWHRGLQNAPTGHVGIVLGVGHHPGIFVTIEGNHGSYPAHVTTREHAVGEVGLLAFVRLPPLGPTTA